MRFRNWAFAGTAAALLALVHAVDARSQMVPGGSVPYRTNRSSYQTNAMVPAHAAVGATSSGCAPAPARNNASSNPGTAGPALTGNANNCTHAMSSGAVKIGPH